MKYSFVFSFVIFMFIIIPKVKAQSLISGFITDTINSPLENVTIILEDEKANVIAYGQTNISGNYTIGYSTFQDTIFIKFRRIGLKMKIKKIPVSLQELDVIMELAPENNLEEIIIKNRRPIESSGDTISYNPYYFKDGTEKNVEELLSKLPGFSVNTDSGIIKYQGREIKKILLDGDDVTGNNYKVLSKNLSAEWLEGIEVVKKFNDKRLLRGIKQSDDIAINLKLSEKAKAPIFGKANLGVGIESKYELKSELLSYLKKLKLFSIAETNNIGSDLVTYDLETYLDNHNGGKGFMSPNRILDNELSPPEFFKNENFTFHQGVFVSNAVLFKPNSNLKIRSLTNFYDNHLNFFTSDSLSYVLPEGLNLLINEFQDQTQRPQEVFQDIKVDYAIRENQDLNIRLQYKNVNTNTSSINKTALINASQTDALIQNRLLTNALYTYKLNEKVVAEVDLRVGSENFDENVEVFYDDNFLQNFNQSFLQSYFNVGGDVNFYAKLTENTFINFYSGWNKSISELRPLFTDKYKFTNLYSEIELRKEIKKFTLNASARMRKVILEFDSPSQKRNLFEPLLAISYEDLLLKRFELTAKTLFSSENNYLHFTQLFNQNTFIDYRTNVTYIADFNLPQTSNLLLTALKIAENENLFLTANVELGLEQQTNSLVPNLTFQDDIVSIQYIQSENLESIFTNIGIDKYFSKLKTNLGFSYSSKLNKSFLSVEGGFGESSLLSQQWKLDAGIVFSKKISVSTFASYNSNSNQWLGDTNYFNFQNYFLKLVYKATQKLRIVGETQVLDFGQQFGGLNSLSNLSAVFYPKNNNWSLNAMLNNVFNLKSVGISNNSPSFFSQTNYLTQPRFFILSLTHRF